MVCRYCQEDVDRPCETLDEMRRRAMDGVERCEKAFADALGDRIDPSDGQSAGSV